MSIYPFYPHNKEYCMSDAIYFSEPDLFPANISDDIYFWRKNCYFHFVDILLSLHADKSLYIYYFQLNQLEQKA